MTRRLEFFYDFSCPYAYLASTQVEALAKRAGAELVWRPFLLGGVFRALGEGAPNLATQAPNRARTLGRDMHRWAAHWGVPFQMPPGHPNRTVTALRAAMASGDVPRASHALYRAYWAEGRDVSRPEVVQAALDGAGLDGAALLRRAEEPAIKDALRAATDEAIERGVFGAPALFVEGELFWGQDRLDFVARALGLPVWDPPLAESPWGSRPAAVPYFELWFDYSSPFAYLAATQALSIAARARTAEGAPVELRWRPFLLGALFKSIGTGNVPLATFSQQKQRWMGNDLLRFAQHHGVPYAFNGHFPLRTLLPLRVTLAAQRAVEQGALPRATLDALVGGLFAAAWAEDRDVGQAEVVGEVCARVGAPAELLAAAETPDIKAALQAATTQAAELGLCGAPTWRVGDELFWGQDRIRFVEQALRGWQG